MQISKNGREIIVEFNSIEDMLEYLDVNKDRLLDSRSINDSDTGFSGGLNYEQSLNMMETGWIDGISKIEVIANQIMGTSTGEQRYIKYDYEGDFCDIGRLLYGEPECCGSFRKRKVKDREIMIMVNTSTHGGISTSAIMTRGAAVQALVNKLQETCFVDLVFVDTAQACMNNNIKIFVRCDTKNFYSKEVIAFISSHPAYLRRVIFRICELLCDVPNCEGYGHVFDIDENEQKRLGVDLYIPALKKGDDRWKSIEQAKVNIERMLQNIQEKQADIPPEVSETSWGAPSAPERPDPLSGMYSSR